MTETGTQTWHELAERTSDMEWAVAQALYAYGRGAPITTVIEYLRKANEETPGAAPQILGAGCQPVRGNPESVSAANILRAGLSHMEDRAATYDKPEGERSMAATVRAFEAKTGISLTEEQGWLFMGTLKDVRSQQGGYRADNYEDRAAYAGLQGEAAARNRGR